MVDYMFIEPFKGSGSGGGGRAGGRAGAASGAASGAAMGAILSGGSAAVMSNSGSNNVEKCPLNDTSLYCQISRTAGIVGMVVYIVMILIIFLAFLYFLYTTFFKSSRKK
jgi:hypothetical protein